jgi:hypothetical protein
MKVVGIIGEPAAGKSTVMRNLMFNLKEGSVVKEGLVVYTIFPGSKVMVAGVYDDQVFSGTDRLSKSCGPKYREWLTVKNSDPAYDDWVFCWEGERFSNNKFFDFFFDNCPESKIYYLKAEEEILDERNVNRSNQNPVWRKGMRTRMENLRSKYPLEEVEQGFELGVR